MDTSNRLKLVQIKAIYFPMRALKSQIAIPKFQIISKSEKPISETSWPIHDINTTDLIVLNFGHWYLFEPALARLDWCINHHP